MTRVDFYHNAADRLLTACRIVRKAYRQGVGTVVFAPKETIAEEIDRLLWTTPVGDFLPHCREGDRLAAETPIVIAAALQAEQAPIHDALLINLDDEVPPGFSRFERIIEIITADEAARESGRQRFRHYRDRGYEVGALDLSKGRAE